MDRVSDFLVEEHKLLFQAVDVATQVQKIEDENLYHELIHDLIIFFRNYTEIYHYPKEENILYPALLKYSKNFDKSFLHEISDNHDDFKTLIAQVENCYELHHHDELKVVFSTYLKELLAHMTREDKIIFKQLENILTSDEQKKLSQEFLKHDEKFGEKDELKEMLFKIKHLIAV